MVLEEPRWVWTGVGINLWFTIAYVVGIYASTEWWLSGRPVSARGWPAFPGETKTRPFQLHLSTLLATTLFAAILLGANLIPSWELPEGGRGEMVRGFGRPLVAYFQVYHQNFKPNSHLFRNWNVATNAGFALGALFLFATTCEAWAMRREARPIPVKRDA